MSHAMRRYTAVRSSTVAVEASRTSLGSSGSTTSDESGNAGNRISLPTLARTRSSTVIGSPTPAVSGKTRAVT